MSTEQPGLNLAPQMPRMLPEQFAAKWSNTEFGEKQASQEMFLDLCAVVGHPTPGDYGDAGVFTFEKGVPGGSADAYLKGCFGWEFKGSDRDLDAALPQLLRYQVHLMTPPLLIVSSFRTIRIQTNFPGMETVRYEIPVADIAQADHLEKLRNVFFNPHRLRPNRTVEAVTKETADIFHAIVMDMEQDSADSEKLAHYLNQLVFCLYAEDAGLLPGKPFSQIARDLYRDPKHFDEAIRDLFDKMATGGRFGSSIVDHFNGDLFGAADTIELSAAALQRLVEATQKNWRDIEPSIFGVLFERALDASKRSYLGAHYTSAADIMLVVEPVVLQPLRREWQAVQQEVTNLLVAEDPDKARVRLAAFQQRLFEVEVLDPACGSGNFLFLALRSLLDLEKEVIDFAAMRGLVGLNDWKPAIKPDQMLGLETNPYAAELARTALWIGYIQWHQNNGFPYDQRPILTRLSSIQRRDAILDPSDAENPREPRWPAAEFIIGNPPFLGNKMMRRELGDATVDAIYQVYDKRLPNGSDLCCYWFEKARQQIASGDSRRAGLLGTQGIRGGVNRRVLQRIKNTGDIFMAHQDREWVLDGAMVHISIVGFDDGSETEKTLDGLPYGGDINPDLRGGANLTISRILKENAGIAFQGFNRVGNFDVSPSEASAMLNAYNPHGQPNSDVLKLYLNAKDILDRPRMVYSVDFGDMSLRDASLYELPFAYVQANVEPKRRGNKIERAREKWWLYQLPSVELRRALADVKRYIATGRVSKHRIFTWIDSYVMPDNALVVFISEDEFLFGVLQSRFHEVWSRIQGTQLREMESGFRYTPRTCFETFPFPEANGEQREAVAEAARELYHLRQGWRFPPDASETELKKRTLTNLYNARPMWLQLAHESLDQAVAAAYGWPDGLTEPEMLERLLELNLQRAAGADVDELDDDELDALE